MNTAAAERIAKRIVERTWSNVHKILSQAAGFGDGGVTTRTPPGAAYSHGSRLSELLQPALHDLSLYSHEPHGRRTSRASAL